MTYSDRDGSEPMHELGHFQGFGHRIPDARTVMAPAGLPLHEPADRDGDNVPSDVAALREAVEFETSIADIAHMHAGIWKARAEKAEADVERLRDEVQKARDEADGWAGRYEALRAALRHPEDTGGAS